jgi:hypothetical protein
VRPSHGRPCGHHPTVRPSVRLSVIVRVTTLMFIVDAIFVQKISNFQLTYGLVLASRHTNFYEIPISSLGAMPQKQNYFEVRAARAAKKLFILKLFWVEFFIKS